MTSLRAGYGGPPARGARRRKAHDPETRERLLTAGSRLFAERGFKHVTVREICRAARANVAAVNYHFGDKLGLYRDVLQLAVASMRSTGEAAQRAGGRGGAEQKLRAYVRVYIEAIVGAKRDSWVHHLMARELADPTPALDLVVQQVVRPRIAYLGGLVAELMGRPIGDERVTRSVHSIHAQCVMIPNMITSGLYPDFRLTPKTVAAVAEHVASFSLAGIGAMRQL